jgi:hypothetical protein
MRTALVSNPWAAQGSFTGGCCRNQHGPYNSNSIELTTLLKLDKGSKQHHVGQRSGHSPQSPPAPVVAADVRPSYLCADVKHGHDVGVAEPVVQQGLQAAARVEVARNLLQHLDCYQRAIPIPCTTENFNQPPVITQKQTHNSARCLLALRTNCINACKHHRLPTRNNQPM